VVWDSSVCIATRYEMDVPGIESRWGWDFPYLSRTALGPIQPPIQWVPSLSRGKAAGAWRWPPIPYSAEVKEGVGTYLYSPSGPSWPVLGWTLPYLYPLFSGIFHPKLFFTWPCLEYLLLSSVANHTGAYTIHQFIFFRSFLPSCFLWFTCYVFSWQFISWHSLDISKPS
jgi:hypothetical protein